MSDTPACNIMRIPILKLVYFPLQASDNNYLASYTSTYHMPNHHIMFHQNPFNSYYRRNTSCALIGK
jgi:hypothetical protein